MQNSTFHTHRIISNHSWKLSNFRFQINWFYETDFLIDFLKILPRAKAI